MHPICVFSLISGLYPPLKPDFAIQNARDLILFFCKAKRNTPHSRLSLCGQVGQLDKYSWPQYMYVRVKHRREINAHHRD